MYIYIYVIYTWFIYMYILHKLVHSALARFSFKISTLHKVLQANSGEYPRDCRWCSSTFCFTSTEAKWLIRDGDGGKGTKEWRLDRRYRPKKTGKTVARTTRCLISLPTSHGRSMCQSRKLYHQRGVTEAFDEEEKHDGGGDGDNDNDDDDNDDDDDHLTWRPQTGRVSTQILSLEVGSPNSPCRRLCYKLGPERLLYLKPTTPIKNNQSKQTQR